MLSGVVNFRDVGGHVTASGATVRTGRIYRSAHFAAATDDDVAELERRDVRLFIDFRSPVDIEAEGHNRMPAGSRWVSIPMYDPGATHDVRTMVMTATPEEIEAAFGGGRALESATKGTVDLVTEPDRIAGYGVMLRNLIDADSAAVIHCSAGKDRTGWGASLILLALGVPEETVVEHYVESNVHRRSFNSSVRTRFDIELLRPFLEVSPLYVRAAIDAMQQRWGTIDSYIVDGLGIPESDLARFRDQMLI